MLFRKADLNDTAAAARMFRDLAVHIRDVTGDPYWAFEDLPLPMAETAIEGYIRGEESCVLMAQEGEEPVGMMILEVIPCHMPLSPHSRVGYIAAGYVKEGWRRRGVMQGLEEMSRDFFRSLSIEDVEVNYLPENDGAKEAWNAMGYHCFREQARKKL